MLGTWNARVNASIGEMKLIFEISKNETYNLVVKTDPVPLNLVFHTVTVEGNRLYANGIYNVFGETEAAIELSFEQSTFSGVLNLHSLGKLQFEGQKGEGESLAAALIDKVKPYRKSEPVRERSDEEIHKEVEKLLEQMTITDKIGQMSQCMASDFSFGGDVSSEPPEQVVAEGKAGSVLGAFDINRVFELQQIAVEQSPLGIPLFFDADIIHGYQTVFPVPLAWASSWDPDAIKRACAISAKEASASGLNYNHGPMVDITRDPRWGRVVEGAGEDPYLGSVIAKAQVEGFQGDSLFDKETMIACLKHFVAYGAAEGGRDYNTVDISEGTLRNVYLPPFKKGLEAGAGSVMNAFNIYNGVPAAGNQELLKKVLREELGFDGMLISDYGSIDEIVVHGAARDREEAAKMAVDATMDIEMVTTAYLDNLPKLIEQERVTQDQLDNAVRRILIYKFKIGLMDDPFRYIRPEKEKAYHFCQEHVEESKNLAQKSMVLLKNNGVLPLDKKQDRIALIGPFANSKDVLGPWQFSRYRDETVTLMEGMKEKGTNEAPLIVAEGCKVEEGINGGFEEAIQKAKQADKVILALGEGSGMSGEAASKMDLELPSVQKKLAEEIAKIGKPTILVLTNGRPLILDWFAENMDAIVESWFLGSQTGHAIANVLYGDSNPSGKLTISFPQHIGQIPVYYNHFNTGRPLTRKNQRDKFISKYIDGPNEPLYPFGYGLSYTSFTYSELQLDKRKLSRSDQLKASVTITNTGSFPGEEIVQLYIQDLYGSVVRPVKELKGFQKIYLNTGESKQVAFIITEEDLKYYTSDMSYQAEIGEFKVYIGTNSQNVKEAGFELVE